jgi:hypothetical protein
MLSLLIFIVGISFYLLQKNKSLIFYLFLPLFFYFLAFDIRESDFTIDLLTFINHINYETYLVYGFVIFVSILIILIFDNLNTIFTKKIANFHDYNYEKLLFLYYFFTFLALCATVINLSHVHYTFSLLLISPREYEMLFGRSTFINYLYFLNVPALCIYIYITNILNKTFKFSTILNILLILISLFHGVKFTVFDSIIIPFLFFNYVSNKGLSMKKAAIIIISLATFYYLFSTFIRGGESGFINQMLSYILPNYYNLAYSIETVPFQWDGLNSIMPDKLPNIFTNFYKYGPEGFILNDKYNMQTAYISYYRFAWMFGPLLFLGIITLVRRYLLNKTTNTLFDMFLLTLIDYCLLFTFFFNAFVKTKYIYYIVIFFIIHKYSLINDNKKHLYQ